jgi:hypothetical protein
LVSKGIGEIANPGEEKMIKKAALLFTFTFFLFALTGCGYTARSMIRNEYQTIYVAPFENKIDVTQQAYAANKYRIYRPTLETDITRAVINRFLTDGNLKPAKEESAGLVMKGELVEFRRDPLRYTSNDEVEEYRINIVVNLALYDKKENSLLWQERNFTGYTTYFTAGPQAKSEDVAVNDALSDLARRTVERTVEQW